MKNYFLFTFLFFILHHADAFSQFRVGQYNVVWNKQSSMPVESMPLSGSKGYGANVWVENGDIYCYLGSSESYDENGDLLKLGALRIHLDPNPFVSNGIFKQELDLSSGKITITGKSPDRKEAKVSLWYDTQDATFFIKSESLFKTQCKVSFATWRTNPDTVNNDNWDIASRLSVILPDAVEQKGNSILWYHQNDNNRLVVKKMVELQKLTEYSNVIQPFTEDLIFGGMVVGKNMKANGSENIQWLDWKGKAWHLESKSSSKLHEIAIVTKVEKEKSIQVWKKKLTDEACTKFSKIASSEKNSSEWWQSFWNKSNISVNPTANSTDSGWQIGRNYQLFRYMLACNRGRRIPLKFNGGIFNVGALDRSKIESLVNNKDGYWPDLNVMPDYRRWGNMFMGQNQRLIGWPSLATGDFELVTPSLDFYADRLKVAEARSQSYWKHGGAAFVEILSLYGLPCQNLASDHGPITARHLAYHFSMQIEFAWMAIQWSNYSGKSIDAYLPFIESVVRFYDEHYRKENLQRIGKELDEKGKLVLYPMNSLEAFPDVTDPVEVVAGLKKVTEALLKMNDNQIPVSTRKYIAEVSTQIPAINFGLKNGKQIIMPAKIYHEGMNLADFPEMYTVWPYSIFSVGKKIGFEEANNTWENLSEDRAKKALFWESWSCTPIYAALMGRTTDAKRLITEKLSDKNSPSKFSAFFWTGRLDSRF